jgi:hypothetical protein
MEAWYPPGHGDFYQSFHNSGLLDDFIGQVEGYFTFNKYKPIKYCSCHSSKLTCNRVVYPHSIGFVKTGWNPKPDP